MSKIIANSIDVSECANYWFDRCCKINSECSKYRQALQEVKEIVETCLTFYKCEKCKFYKECQYDLEEYIITKINEVIGTE